MTKRPRQKLNYLEKGKQLEMKRKPKKRFQLSKIVSDLRVHL